MEHVSKLASGLIAYADAELIPRVNGSLQAWGIGAAVTLVCDRMLLIIKQLSDIPMFKTMGLIDGEMVDVDGLYHAIKPYADKQTATIAIPLIGTITFTNGDLDKLYTLIKQA